MASRRRLWCAGGWARPSLSRKTDRGRSDGATPALGGEETERRGCSGVRVCLRQFAAADQPSENVPLPADRRREMAEGIERAGRLGQPGEQRGLSPAQLIGGEPEIALAGCGDPGEAVAEVHG